MTTGRAQVFAIYALTYIFRIRGGNPIKALKARLSRRSRS